MSDLPANARYCVLTEPLWTLATPMVIFYGALYMKSVGLSTAAIGVVTSAGIYAGLLCQLAAGPLINRLGRRRATLIFDLVAWTVPLFIWAFSQDFWAFLIGYLLNGASKITGVSFALLATEDAPEEQRGRVFSAINLMITTAGLLTPVVGMFMTHYGTVPTLRAVHVIAGLSTLVHFLWRHRLTTETATGGAAMHRHRSVAPTAAVIDNLRVVRTSWRGRRMRLLAGIFVLTNLGVQLNLFQVIYFGDVLDFSTTTISWLPALGAALALPCYLLLVPRLRETPPVTTTAGSLALCSLGFGVFFLLPAGNLVLLLAGGALTGAGLFLVQSYRDALAVNELEGQDRAALLSALHIVTALVAVPSGYLAAVLYDLAPRLLLGVVFGCYAVSTVLALALRGSGHRPPVPKAVPEHSLT